MARSFKPSCDFSRRHAALHEAQPAGSAGTPDLRRRIADLEKTVARLRTAVKDANRFRSRQKALLDASVTLARAASFDFLCRQAVELGRARLGFDRLGLWFLDRDRDVLVGTFGTDEGGQTRDEHGLQCATGPVARFLTGERRDVQVLRRTGLYDDRCRVIGTGQMMRAPMWDGAGCQGLLCADNLLCGRPFTRDDVEILRMYAAVVGHLCARARSEDDLRRSRERERALRVRQAVLMEVTNELSLAPSVDELCRRAVEAGVGRLGFDRLGIWFLDENQARMVGSFGIDEQGRVRDERGRSGPVAAFILERISSPPYHALRRGVPLYNDREEIVGHGDQVFAAITEGPRLGGFLVADNLVRGRPMDDDDAELLWRFAGALGHLCKLKRTEEDLRRMQDDLEIQVEERTEHLKAANRWLQQEITERRRTEQALRVSEERLRRSERLASIGTLAAGIAHEINNPIGAILLAAQFGLRHGDGPQAAEVMARCLHDVIRDAARCSGIVRNVLQFARREPLQLVPGDVNEPVRRAVAATRAYAREHGARLAVELAEALPAVNLNATGIEQVVVNLLRNAVEAGEQGVDVQVATALSDGRVRIIVRDNGRGMSRQDQQRIFDPFFTTQRHQGAVGLGMSVSHGIVQQHHGEIAVDSQLGRGTTVVVELPVAPGAGKTDGQSAGRR